MTRLFAAIMITSSLATSAFAANLTLELAGGVGSPYTPFSSKWEGSISDGGLFHKEIAGRAAYRVNGWLSVSGTIGRVTERRIRHGSIVYDMPPIPPYPVLPDNPHQNVTYFIPSFRMSHEVARFDFGAVIFSAAQHNSTARSFDYPFNGSHRFKPSMGIELGENSLYIFIRSLMSFPLNSGGLGEVGLGGRVSGQYEHKVAILGGPFEAVGIGYRGEFRVYRSAAFSIGFSFGGTDRDNIFIMSFGLKTII